LLLLPLSDPWLEKFRTGFIYSGVTRQCVSCEGKSNMTFLILIGLLMLGGIASVFADWIGDKLIKIDPGSVKVIWTTVNKITRARFRRRLTPARYCRDGNSSH
jgi:hypothetical protein